MAVEIPPFEHTPIQSIPSIVNEVRNTFHSHRTRPVEYRLVQLRKFYWGLKDNEQALAEACRLDLGKSQFEAFVSEIEWVKNDVIFTTNNLQKWVQDEKAPDIPLTNRAVSPKIRKDPLGCILVIGAYNFPIQLSLGPLIGAIAAGCTAVLKPSEAAPASAAVMQKIILESLDHSAYTVVQGGIPETTSLLEEQWDKIFYTGSSTVGKIIARKAAETLTPVTLELGGRNSAIVTKNADPKLAARRLLWGKTLNAGQVCTSQNYIVVDKDILPTFLAELEATMKEFYPQGAKASPDYGRIVNERQFRRLKGMLDNSRGKILLGGSMDEKELFLEPTVVQVDDLNDPLVIDESFGPLIPIYTVNDLDEAIKVANQVHSTPLAIYPFGNKKETDRVLRETRSGGASVNDSFFHASIPTLAFGGVGESGQGSYRGKASFDAFTHRRSVTTTPNWMEFLLSVRYPPYKGKLAQFQKMANLTPNFDRDGNVKHSLVRWILKLGAGDSKGALARYIIVVVAAVGMRQYLEGSSKL
ncbi:MAG: hypothetical protein M1836_002805 [Candelina mexicana]|nr:MAG: hypothetical protein M1836_002805 [Candelina mexicana]